MKGEDDPNINIGMFEDGLATEESVARGGFDQSSRTYVMSIDAESQTHRCAW